MKKTIIILIASLGLALSASAQNWAVSTNVMDYVSLGTINAQLSAGVGRRITIEGEARYNPWIFHKGDVSKQMQNKHQTYALGVRYWPWHIYSGWWITCMAQYQEYNWGGIFSPKTEEGDAFGLSA